MRTDNNDFTTNNSVDDNEFGGRQGRRGRRGRMRHHPDGGAWGGPWADWADFGGGRGGRGGRRGPRVRRGDVRSAILDVLSKAGESDEPINGYQVIQQIAERSQGAWRPSPGSVYPTIQQLEDEGLVESDEARGRRAIKLSDQGRAYATEHADELAAVWAPFDREESPESGIGGLRGEIAQVMPAVWQIATAGSDTQREAAAEILAETRRKLYGILADGAANE